MGSHSLWEKESIVSKSEKCIFVGYSEDVKGYRLLQSHCNEIIIRRYVKFDENLLSCKPNSTFLPSSSYEPSSTFVPSLACEPSSTFMPSSIPILVSSSYDDSEDENTPLYAHLPLNESFENEPTLAPPLPRWVCLTREAVGDLVSDPSDQCQTCHSSSEPLLF